MLAINVGRQLVRDRMPLQILISEGKTVFNKT